MSIRRRGGTVALAVVASGLLLGTGPANASTTGAALTVHGPSSHPFAGSTFHITGTLAPTGPGEQVRLQRRVAGGFRTIATRTVSAAGGFDFATRIKPVGSYVYRVEKPASGALAETSSAALPVFVTGSTLPSGGALPPGTDLWSPHLRYRLQMGAGGNLVLRDRRRSTVVWATHTAGRPGSAAVLRPSGELVVRRGSRTLWSSGRARRPGSVLTLRDDGHLVVSRRGRIAWSTYPPPPVPPFGARAMTRAQSWVSAHVAYSMGQAHTNRYGSYRRDCSGYVSMAWALGSSYSTRTLPRVAHVISKDRVRRGDLLLHQASGGGAGHAVLFDRWANRAHTSYVAFEEIPGSGATHHTLPYPYWRSHGRYTPYRRNGT